MSYSHHETGKTDRSRQANKTGSRKPTSIKANPRFHPRPRAHDTHTHTVQQATRKKRTGPCAHPPSNDIAPVPEPENVIATRRPLGNVGGRHRFRTTHIVPRREENPSDGQRWLQSFVEGVWEPTIWAGKPTRGSDAVSPSRARKVSLLLNRKNGTFGNVVSQVEGDGTVSDCDIIRKLESILEYRCEKTALSL